MDVNDTTEHLQDNPWKHFETLPTVGRGSQIFAALMYLIASVAIPLGFYNQVAAIGFGAVLLILGFLQLRGLHPLIWLTLLASAITGFLPAFLLPVQSAGLFVPGFATITAAMCMGLLGGTYLQTTVRNFGGLAILSLLAGGAVWLITGDWIAALASLALLPAVLLLSLATNLNEYCTTAICYAAGGFLVCAIAAALIGIWYLTGGVRAEGIRALLSGWQEQILQMQVVERDSLLAMIRELRLEEGSTEQMNAYLDTLTEQLMTTMSDEMLRTSVQQIFNLIPAIVFLFCAIPAYLSKRMLNASYTANGLHEVVTPEAEFFTMSLPSAVIFLLSYLLMLFLPASVELPALAASNLCVMLLPGFLIVGWHTLRSRLRGSLGGRLFPLFIVLVFCCLSLNLLFILSAFGACERIFAAIRRRFINKASGDDHADGDA